MRLPGLTSNWQKVSTLVDAPVGTSTVFVAITGGSGRRGDYLYLDDIVVGDAPNVLDADAADFESSAAGWQPWFSTSISRSTEHAFRGAGSLRVDVTDPYGWGVTLSNWPGFATPAGSKRVSFWAKQGTPSVPSMTLRVEWFNVDRQRIQFDDVPLTGMTTDWKQAVATVTARPGTAWANVQLISTHGVPGDTVYVDDIVVAGVD